LAAKKVLGCPPHTPGIRGAASKTEEAMIEFTRRARGPKTLEDCNIFDMIRRTFGEIILELTEE
jgi:hypothetical protein